MIHDCSSTVAFMSRTRHQSAVRKMSNMSLPKIDVVANTNYFPATGIPIPKPDWKVEYLDGECEYRIRETAGYHENE